LGPTKEVKVNTNKIEWYLDRIGNRIKRGFVTGLALAGLACTVRLTVVGYGLVAVVFWVGATATALAVLHHIRNAVEDGRDARGHKET
jgi:hypothetical protein